MIHTNHTASTTTMPTTRSQAQKPLHLAFQRCDAEAALTLFKRECWTLYNGEDKLLLLHMTVKAFAFTGRASPYCEWFSLIEWLQKTGQIAPTVQDSEAKPQLIYVISGM